jgi:hypothetical protein
LAVPLGSLGVGIVPAQEAPDVRVRPVCGHPPDGTIAQARRDARPVMCSRQGFDEDLVLPRALALVHPERFRLLEEEVGIGADQAPKCFEVL